MDAFGALTRMLDRPGREKGSLKGLSFVVKENIDVEGLVSTNGEPAFAASHAPAGVSAPAVDRLLACGARLTGKAHMDEMAYSLLGANHHYGTPINPAAPERHPGGSSSGSAVAVAGGLADFALGTDTAGSCRAPASFCGIYGFRPSHGAISSNGVVPLAPSLDTIGWFARDSSVLQKVGEALLPDDLDFAPFGRPIGIAEAFADCPFEEADLLKAALGSLRKDFPLHEVRLGLPFSQEMLNHFRNLQAHEAYQSQGVWIEKARPEFGPGVAERFAYAANVTEEQKLAADEFRIQTRAIVDDCLGQDGFFVLPTTPFFAPLLSDSAQALDEKRYQMFRLFLIASFFGLPQVSLPLKTPGASLGISLIGRRWSDRGLLALAKQVAARLWAS
jgi:amidase